MSLHQRFQMTRADAFHAKEEEAGVNRALLCSLLFSVACFWGLDDCISQYNTAILMYRTEDHRGQQTEYKTQTALSVQGVQQQRTREVYIQHCSAIDKRKQGIKCLARVHRRELCTQSKVSYTPNNPRKQPRSAAVKTELKQNCHQH